MECRRAFPLSHGHGKWAELDIRERSIYIKTLLVARIVTLGLGAMEERQATVKSKLGLHARPSALLVQATAKLSSEITLIKDGLEVNGKSIMGVMMLAAEVGSKIMVRADGADEVEAAEKVVKMIESAFD